jgi:DNA-directed RNA polymerase subunit RPC12/RpoP
MRCPGQDTQYWNAKAIYEAKCPKCDRPVEFFKDDTTRKCGHCGHRFVNPQMDFGCAAYCPFAEQCLGTLPPELVAQKDNLFKDRVAIEVKRHLKTDFKRIGHASRLARYVERIQKREQGNPATALIAAYLLPIVAQAAAGGAGQASAEDRRRAAAAIAGQFLSKLGAGENLITAVADVLAALAAANPQAPVEVRVLHDAEAIVRLEDQQKTAPLPADELQQQLNGAFLTDGGREAAAAVLLKP